MGLPPFQAFLDEHRDEVYRFLVVAAGRDEADDCFQETFLSALRAYPRLRPGSDLRAWILTIASRKAVDAHRRRGRRPVPSAEIVDSPVVAGHDGEPALWAAVRGLPPGQRSAIAHRFVNDLRYGEIAAILGCSEAAARQRVREGLRTLREVWTT